MSNPTCHVKSLLSKSLISAVVFAGIGAFFEPAYARPIPYNVVHNFRILPGGNVLPVVNALTYQHAWVHDPGLRSAVNPLGQPAGFKNDGREFVAGNGQVGQFGLGVPLNEVATAIPAAGAAAFTSTANVPPPFNSAQANSTVTVNAFVAGGAVTGRLQVHGFADAVRRKDAYAFSSARVTARGANRGRGRIDWRPAVSSGTLADGSWAVFDPINFEMFDLDTGDLLKKGTLLEIISEGDGTIAWDADLLSFNTTEMTFSIDISGEFTDVEGRLLLEVTGGLVTSAEATGIFGSLSLPSLGSSGAFSMSLPNDFALEYDLDPEADVDRDIGFDFSGGGRAYIEAPEPVTLSLLGAGILGIGVLRRRQTA